MAHKQPVAALALLLLLIITAILISFSNLLSPYALQAWPVVLGASLIAYALAWRRTRQDKAGGSIAGRIPFVLTLQALLAAGVTQVLAANDLPSGLLPLHALPGRTLIYLIMGGSAAFSLTWLALVKEEWASGGAALAAAGLYGSVAFFRLSAVPEVGYAFSLLAGFGLLAFLSLSKNNLQVARSTLPFWRWTLAFMVVMLGASAISPVPGQSIKYLLYFFVLAGLAALVAFKIQNLPALKTAAWLVVALGAGLPVVLAVIKSADILIKFGPQAALAYRLHPNEMGGANLIARSILVAAPFCAALMFNQPYQGRWKGLRITSLVLLQISILGVLLYARSYEGFFAWLVALFVFAVLAAWKRLHAYWSRIASRSMVRLALGVAAILLLAGTLYAGVRIGYTINPYSFNGRFGHWIGALTAIKNRPFLGGGPDNEYLFTKYASGASLFSGAQEFVDDPLYLIRYRTGVLTAHAHNLFLETATFSGLAGLASFVGIVGALIWLGLKTWKRAEFQVRIILAASVAAIFGELAWGLLDVVRESPPFFTFPIWAIIGVVLAAARLTAEQRPQTSPIQVTTSDFKIWGLSMVLIILVGLIPSLSANLYESGFLAYQEHRWQDAAKSFRSAAVFDSISAHYRWMLSKAELEMGQFGQAEQHLEKAMALKRGYSPFLVQAGWLAWLQGDLDAAGRYFEEAIASDPLEGWSPGLHANLGLLRVYQGRQDEAVEYFARSLELHPEQAAAPYWIKSRQSDGDVQVILAPAYRQPSVAGDLRVRLLAHLGISDITERHFDPSAVEETSLSLAQVLDKVHEKYLAAASQHDPDAHLILAAEAEAARMSGLDERAEKLYLEYQSLHPDSAYGYRDIASVYAAQERLEEAELSLEKALQVSPRNIDALRMLTFIQLERQDPAAAEETFSQATPVASSYSFQFRFFNVDLIKTMLQLYQAAGNPTKERQALQWLTQIQGAPDDFLALARFAQEKAQWDVAAGYCWQAYKLLVKGWVRPYDERLWQVADCISQSAETDEQISKRLDMEHTFFIRQLFQGHIARLRNQPDLSADDYLRAAAYRSDESAPHYYLGELFASQGRIEEAESQYLRAAELDTKETLALLSLGTLYEANGNPDRELKSYQLAVSRTPGWDEAQLALGNFYLKSGDFTQADAHFEMARRLSGVLNPDQVYDFASHLASADLSANARDGYIKDGVYEINGVHKFSIFMHPVSAATYNLRLPELKESETLWLDFSAGMLPESWSQPGDGVDFSITLQVDDRATDLYSSYIDPKHNLQDRQWKAEKINLSPYSGREVTLTFKTDGGEAGDLQYDWAAWGEPVILLVR